MGLEWDRSIGWCNILGSDKGLGWGRSLGGYNSLEGQGSGSGRGQLVMGARAWEGTARHGPGMGQESRVVQYPRK